jgi:hypothetical protein
MMGHKVTLMAMILVVVALIVPAWGNAPENPRWGKPIQWAKSEGPEAREHGAVITTKPGP